MLLRKRSKKWKTIAIVLLLLLMITAAALAAWFFWQAKNPPPPVVKSLEKPVPPSPEELPMLLERMAAPPPLTPEEIAEDARMDAEQVAHAQAWLESADPQQRIDGAEQLSAYPTAEAEKLLVETLLNDSEPEVRSAAARSLEYVENPAARTLDAMQQALENDNEAVAVDVLNTLAAYVAREPYASERATAIIDRLKQVAQAGLLQGNAATVLENFLQDQSADEGKSAP